MGSAKFREMRTLLHGLSSLDASYVRYSHGSLLGRQIEGAASGAIEQEEGIPFSDKQEDSGRRRQ
jgi:hypothetical protein